MAVKILWFTVLSACLTACQMRPPPPGEIVLYVLPMDQRKVDHSPHVETLPDGIGIRFSKNPVPAIYIPHGRDGPYYTRVYSVTLRAVSLLRMETWGVSVSSSGQDHHYEFNKQDFAKVFSCLDGVLRPNTDYICTDGGEIGGLLGDGKATWHFVAVDQDGRKFKGRATVYSLPVAAGDGE